MIDSIDKKIIVPEGTDKGTKNSLEKGRNKEGFEASELKNLKAEVFEKVTNEEKQEAEDTLKKFSGNNKGPEHVNTQVNISKAVKDLNRPEAEQGIAQSYTAIESTIKNSANDKNIIARTAGKIMNRILS